MALVPAICDTCRTLFGSENVIGGSGTVTIIGGKLGPCPKCGGWGSIPDGIYEFVGETLNIVSSWEPQRIKRLVEGLEEAKRGSDRRGATERVVAEEPELRQLAERFLIPRNPAEFWTVIAVLLTAANLILDWQRDPTIQINPQIIIEITIPEDKKLRK